MAVMPLLVPSMARDSASHSPAPDRAAMPSRFNRPELDALRLFAFLMVWLAHSLPGAPELSAHHVVGATEWWLLAFKDAGNFGVCVFFFLSAYLITELLRRERALTGTIALPAFYIRRILRIWPLYLGVLALYALLGLRFHGFCIEPGRLLASVLLAGNWYIFLHPVILTPMRALWSISVEEQFYLGWPLVVRFANLSRAQLVAWSVLACSIASTAILALTLPAAWLHITLWVNSLVQFQYFALGSLTALLLRGATPALSPGIRLLCLTGAATLALAAAGVCLIKRATVAPDALARTCGYTLVGILCILLFFAALGLQRVPALAVELGRISFGLYVFHETGFFLADTLFRRIPVLIVFRHYHWAGALALNKALALALTIPIALASYRIWEKPFLRFKDRFTVVRSRRA